MSGRGRYGPESEYLVRRRQHERLRRRLASVVAAGDAICCRCGGPILVVNGKPESWDVDHVDGDRSSYMEGPTGPTAHSGCNRRAGGRRGGRATARARRRRVWSRQWLTEDP